MVKRIIAIVLVFLLLSFTSCAGREQYQSRVIFTMDTVIEIYISADRDVTELLNKCESLIYEIETLVSRTKNGSDVYLLNQNGSAECSEHTVALLEYAKTVYEWSSGAYDPTVLPVTLLWEKYDGGEHLPDVSEMEAALSSVGFDRIKRDGNLITLGECQKIDFGGIAKGYIADRVVELIEQNRDEYGVNGGILSFGGAVSVFGEKRDGSQYRIGIRDPDAKDKTLGRVTVSSGHISVSGDYERYVTVADEKYHHLLDPKNGYPADLGVRSVSVVGGNGAICDALSTAMFVLGYEASSVLYDSTALVDEYGAVFVMNDGSVKTIGDVKFDLNKE